MVRRLYLASVSLTLKTSVVMGQHVSLAPTMCSAVPQRDLGQIKRQAANQVSGPVSAHCPNGFQRGIFNELFLLLKFPINYSQILLARKSRKRSKVGPRRRIKRLQSQVRLACAQLCGIMSFRKELEPADAKPVLFFADLQSLCSS